MFTILEKKFRYLTQTNSQKNKIARELLSCITEKLNGFHIVRMETENEIKVLYYSTDIIFDPVKHHKIRSNSFFSTEKHLAHRSTYNETKDKIKHVRAYQ